jgi:hypothetical protein
MGNHLDMKKLYAAALLLVALTGMAYARTKHPAKPLHKNAPHTYTKHTAAKHPKTIHAHS